MTEKLDSNNKEKWDFECRQIKEGSPFKEMRFGEELSVFGDTWLLALTMLQATGPREQLHSPAGPQLPFLCACLQSKPY